MSQSNVSFIKRITNFKELGPTLAIIILVIALSFSSPYFLTISNLFNIARQISMIAIMAVGIAYVIICAEIDLSVGSTFGLSASLLAIMLKDGANPFLAIFTVLLLGLFIGTLNGLLVTKIAIPAFIATLGTMSIVRGLALVSTGGWPVSLYGNPKLSWVGYLGSGKLFGIFPMQAVFMIIILAIGGFLLHKTIIGYHIFAVGGNLRASEFSGISVLRTKVFAFAAAGLLAALAGILATGFTAQAEANYGTGMELDVIAAAVIGGISMQGGKGSILGVFLGAVTMGILLNGLVLLGVSPFIQKIVVGSVLIVAVAVGGGIKFKNIRRRSSKI